MNWNLQHLWLVFNLHLRNTCSGLHLEAIDSVCNFWMEVSISLFSIMVTVIVLLCFLCSSGWNLTENIYIYNAIWFLRGTLYDKNACMQCLCLFKDGYFWILWFSQSLHTQCEWGTAHKRIYSATTDKRRIKVESSPTLSDRDEDTLLPPAT